MPAPDSYSTENLAYFLTEAQDLLQTIEQTLVDLRQERTTARIHELMRAAHTLKGAAASVGQRAIQEVAHVLEDIFKALYNPAIPIDVEVEALLFEGYECLRRPIAAALHGETADESDVMNRAAGIIARLQEKFGAAFDPEAAMPTSVELGFDLVQSMFEVGVTQYLEELHTAIQIQDASTLAATLQNQAELFLGFAESLDLPGFGAIAQTTLTALEAHPDQVTTIAQLALADFSAGREQVLAGDRTVGGAPSPALQQLATEAEAIAQIDTVYEAVQAVDSPASLEDLEVPVDLDAALAEVLIALEETEASSQSPSSFDLPLEQESRGQAVEENAPMDAPWLDDDTTGWVEAWPFSPPVTSQEPQVPSPEPEESQGAIAPKTSSTIRVDLDHLENLNHFFGELLVNQNRQSTQNEALRAQVQSLVDGLQWHQHMLHHIQDWANQWLMQSAAYPTRQGQVDGGTLFKSAMPALTEAPRLAASLATFDALEMDRYSSLHSLVQDALTGAARLETTAELLRQLTKQTQHITQSQQRLLTHIRDDLTDMRMAPLGSIFNRFPAMVKRLTATHQKWVDLQIVGNEVLVDKMIADQLYDPLLHLVRNGFDHGIEPPEVRRAQGKGERGQIRIEAYHQGRYTVIEVSDDGRGIDFNQIRQQVLALGLCTPDVLSQYSDRQIMDFLFEPGFSTRQQVNDLSGRGMGLDIVRSQIAAMKGSVQVHSLPHRGTTFILHIPISLTVTKMLVCRSGNIAYAFPVQRIERILLPKPHTYKIHFQRRALQVFEPGYEGLIPLRSLAELLTYGRGGDRVGRMRQEQGAIASSSAHPSVPYILLLHTKQKRWALQVEQIVGEQELVVRPLSGMHPPDYIFGGAMLGNNDVALALDPDVLFPVEDQATQEVASIPLPSTHPTTLPPAQSSLSVAASQPWLADMPPSAQDQVPASTRYILLVVDDSLTVRQTLAYTLQSQGYSVIQAQDGQDAIQKLQAYPQVHLVLCDIEMPKLNGFEFLSYSRQHPEFSKIPVVMLTSRTAEKHRQLALDLGAAAYMTKPYLESELIPLLEAMLRQTLQQA